MGKHNDSFRFYIRDKHQKLWEEFKRLSARDKEIIDIKQHDKGGHSGKISIGIIVAILKYVNEKNPSFIV